MNWDVIYATAIGTVLFCIYMTPALIAGYRHHKNLNAIAAANLFFGWTGLGWLGCLVWGLTDNTYKNINVIAVLISCSVLSSCGTYTTRHEGEYVYIENKGGIAIIEVLHAKLRSACPKGYEVISARKQADGTSFYKGKCINK